MATTPETSQEAKQLKTNESKQRDYDRIVAALKVLGKAHYEDIALQMGEKDLNVCSRRMKELRDAGIIEISIVKDKQEKKPTSRNRNAFVHKLSEGTPKPKEKKAKREKKPLAPDQKFIEVSAYKRRVTNHIVVPNQNKLF